MMDDFRVAFPVQARNHTLSMHTPLGTFIT